MTSAPRLGDSVELVHREMLQHLLRARRPVDDDAVDPFAATDPEVQTPVVLAGEPHSTVDDAPLRKSPPACLHHHLGTDRAPVAARSHEPEGDPVVRAVGLIAVAHTGLVLV